jgi:hypothetical protein
MLIGVELCGQAVLLNQLVVVRHGCVADDGLIAMVFLCDDPYVRGSRHALRASKSSEDKKEEYRDT